MEKLHKLSEWRPDMPQRITGLTTEELEVLERVTNTAACWDPHPENIEAGLVWEKINAELERRRNGE